MRRSNGSAACACRAARNMSKKRLCTKNTSWALIERPYSCAPQAVGAVYDRPGFFVQSRKKLFAKADEESIDIIERAIHDLRKLGVTIVDPGTPIVSSLIGRRASRQFLAFLQPGTESGHCSLLALRFARFENI